jgi:hypothetical protein
MTDIRRIGSGATLVVGGVEISVRNAFTFFTLREDASEEDAEKFSQFICDVIETRRDHHVIMKDGVPIGIRI